MEYQLEYLVKLHPNQSGILSSANKLYQHRSWTGFLIDSISFVEERGGLRAVQADVNRQREQYSQTYDAEDVARIELMVRGLAEQNQSFRH